MSADALIWAALVAPGFVVLLGALTIDHVAAVRERRAGGEVL